MADRVKVYEEKEKRALPILAWLLPLLLLAIVAFYFMSRHKDEPAAVSAIPAQTPSVAALPDLGTVHFETDKATLTSEGQATLERAAVAMKANPNAHLRLEGFTDSSGTLPHNATLSQQRTMAVADFLKGQGIDGSRLTGQGFGPAKPVNTNATASGEADNRRVELFSQR